MPSAAETEHSCTHCNKKQAELSHELKQCAKCRSQAYCSRDCQKLDWKNHKKVCAAQQAETQAGSKEDVLELAIQTANLLKALSHAPEFNTDLRAISAPGLRYIADFVSRSFREYWPPLLPPSKYAELTAGLTSFHGLEKEKYLSDMNAKFEEMKTRDTSFDKDAWPTHDSKKYSDCISRNFMAAKIITTPSQQAMMGGAYNYSQEVKNVCRSILSG